MSKIKVGDKVRFKDGVTKWDGVYKEVTLKTICATYDQQNVIYVEESPSTGYLSDMVLVPCTYPIEWTDEKEDELNNVLDNLRVLEERKAELTREQRSQEVHNQKAFLTELAALLSKYEVAVCADAVGAAGVYAEVFYQFESHALDSDLRRYSNGRSHSTGNEYLCRLGDIT